MTLSAVNQTVRIVTVKFLSPSNGSGEPTV